MSEWSAAGGAWTAATRRAEPAVRRDGKAAPEGGTDELGPTA